MCKCVTLFTAADTPRKTCFIQQIGFVISRPLLPPSHLRQSCNPFLRESRIISSLIPSTPKRPLLFPGSSCVFLLAVNIGYISVFYLFLSAKTVLCSFFILKPALSESVKINSPFSSAIFFMLSIFCHRKIRKIRLSLLSPHL